MTTRDRTPEPPYCWQNKKVRKAIRERMNGHESTSATLSLYDALTEIASNEGVESFKAGQPYIGEIAGLSARTVRRLETILEEIGAVTIFRPPLRGHHTYTLLSLGQGGLTLGQHCNQASCPPVEEHKKNREETENKGARAPRFDAGTVSLPFSSSAFQTAWSEWTQHRSELRKPLTATSTAKQLATLATYGEPRAIAAITHSIQNGWQGIFEPKAGHSPKKQNANTTPGKYGNFKK
jgi:hypothetical protein